MSCHPDASHHNWLVHRITAESLSRELRRFAHGDLVDIGCGSKPYAALTKGLVSRHIGVDHCETAHDRAGVDIFASCYCTTLPDQSADTVLCTFVFEHLERPQDAMREIGRILKPGGYMILGAPLFWHLHEEPRDFFRYTKYGLRHLFTTAGFETVEIKPLSGFVVTFAQELSYYLEAWNGSVFAYPVRLLQFLLQAGAYLIYRLGKDRAYSFTWAYLAVARKLANG